MALFRNKNNSRLLLLIFLISLPVLAEDLVFQHGFENRIGPPIARIEVLPGGVLFTEINDSKHLQAQAFDANNQLIPGIKFSWTSNDSATISISSDGVAVALAGLGSAQIVATAEDFVSPPVTVLVAEPVTGALLIDDDEVLVSPDLVDISADLGLGLQFFTTLDGTTVLQLGDIIIGTGIEPIGGEVISISIQGDGSVIVTYELLPLDELFASFLLEETYDLSKVPTSLGETAAQLYDIEDLGNGTIRLTLKPETNRQMLTERTQQAAGAASTKFQIGPFECEASVQPPFSLTSNPGTIDLTTDISLSVLFAVPLPFVTIFELARLDGEIRADFKAELTLASQLEAEVKCEALGLIEKTIPIPGPAVVLSPTVTLGPTVKLGGKIETQSLGIELTASAGADGFYEIRCPPNDLSNCSLNADLNTPAPTADYKISIPDPGTFGNAKIQPELSAGMGGKVTFGLPPRLKRLGSWLGKMTIEAAKASLGLKQTGDLAFVKTQIDDDTYSSNYKLAYDWEASAGEDIEKLLNFLSRLIGFSIPTSTSGTGDLAVSPKAIKAEADVDFFLNGDTVMFKVDLEANTTDYPFFGYNVDKIKIYRKDLFSNIDQIAEVVANDGQASFVIPWTSDANGSITEENYYAFVTTNALPVPGIGELELKDVAVEMCDDGAATCTFNRSAMSDPNAEPVRYNLTLYSGDFIIVGLPGNTGDTGDGKDEFTRWIYDYKSDVETINQLDPAKLITAKLDVRFEGGGGNDNIGIHGLTQMSAFPDGIGSEQSYDLLAEYSAEEIIDKINVIQSSSSTGVTATEGELLMGYQDDAVVESASFELVFAQACPVTCPSGN